MGVSWHAIIARRDERLVHLDTLRAAVETRPALACGVVERDNAPALSVVRHGGTGPPVEVGCDYARVAWWFTWTDGRLIKPVQDIDGAVAVLIRELMRL